MPSSRGSRPIVRTGDPVPAEARRTGARRPGRVEPAVPPALLTGAGRTPEGAAWLATLPSLVTRALRRWDLTAGAPFPSGSASWCAPVTRDGADLVLKISFPHDEARDEAAVLAAWDGRGAVRLVDHDGPDWALLLERVRPGTPMRAVRTPVVRRLAEAADVLRVLHEAPAPARLPRLTAVAASWADLAAERADRAARAGLRLDAGLLRAADDVLRAPAAAREVTLHGDGNPGNLLADRAGGWRAIDPKALRGDPAYDPWPLLEQVGDPWRSADPVRTLRERLLLVAERAGLDPAAAAGWALARGTEAALWAWHHGGPPATLAAGLRRAGDWARVRDALTG
ncbi:aminoglycoside phosphotransferase family protein [Cellulomonas hominis]|uniref:aminoglycoside phosphotransferase family protein n=1 Tax=Cellulomonas hominis TaxID=156981 RepID=UPI001BD0EE15|nr:aminoglycoside phosphotransferase family protein [Cellulomonas hominis]